MSKVIGGVEVSEFDLMKSELKHRKEFIGAILPGASWITLKGNFTSNELRMIADEIDKEFAKIIRN